MLSRPRTSQLFCTLRRRLRFLLTAMLASVIVMSAPVQVKAEAFLTLSDYTKLNDSQQRAYIAGLVDGMLLMSEATNLSGRRWLLDCIRQRAMDQLHEIFDSYIKENPDVAGYAAAGEFAMAMNQSCPRTPF